MHCMYNILSIFCIFCIHLNINKIFGNQMLEDTSMRIKKEVKRKLLDLDFVKRQSENDIVKYLIEFYEKNKKRGNK